MHASVNLILGPVRSGKSALLWEQYRSKLAPKSYGSLLWLGPNHRAVEEIRQRVANDMPNGCLLPGCYTFAQFADKILVASDIPIRPIDQLLKRQILRQVIETLTKKKQLQHFSPIATSDGFLIWLDELISDLKRQEIWPDD